MYLFVSNYNTHLNCPPPSSRHAYVWLIMFTKTHFQDIKLLYDYYKSAAFFFFLVNSCARYYILFIRLLMKQSSHFFEWFLVRNINFDNVRTLSWERRCLDVPHAYAFLNTVLNFAWDANLATNVTDSSVVTGSF